MLNRNALKGIRRSVNKKIITILSFVNVKTEEATHIGDFSYIADATKNYVTSTEKDVNIVHTQHPPSEEAYRA